VQTRYVAYKRGEGDKKKMLHHIIMKRLSQIYLQNTRVVFAMNAGSYNPMGISSSTGEGSLCVNFS
jgi:hypothetical protein